ncbi:MAG: hypothetical protein ABIA37_05605 [Candidatus Woesearchaeota archaeon]
MKDIQDLDVYVLAALELFSEVKIPNTRVKYKRPLIVGSGNAAATGKILGSDLDAVFADESNFEGKLKKIKAIDGVVLISASGGKHAPIIVKTAQRYKKKITLITNNEHALAKEFADEVYIFPKNKEPYTYNVSTYLGMILGKTKEDPQKILQFIKEKIDRLVLPDFKGYKKYYLLVPEEFVEIIRMLNVKFMELFGRNIARDIETFEYAKHSTTVVPAEKELFISFGKKNDLWGKERLFVPLPKNANYGAMMAISYYLIGMIQKEQPAWFRKNIVEYTQKASKIFKQEIKPIVK